MKPQETEKLVRNKLAGMFGMSLRHGKLVIGHVPGKIPQIHEFDLVSENVEVVGEIKSGRCSRTNYNLALVDCVYLSKVKARTKLMVFTDKRLCEYFKQNSAGVVSKDIQVIHVATDARVQSVNTCSE
jgi:delta-aminolevulinic acid dehydratase/porphobilinogen synthase